MQRLRRSVARCSGSHCGELHSFFIFIEYYLFFFVDRVVDNLVLWCFSITLDYLGYRMICMSLLPISTGTLQYGSAG